MKYGKTERISGIVILLALLAIFIPWLMSDPAPREERPQPTFVIEQPVDVVRQEVPAPEMPETINTPSPSASIENIEDVEIPVDAMPRVPDTDQVDAPSQEPSEPEDEPTRSPVNDPIAELVAARDTGSSSDDSAPAVQPQGEWAVQVGSFGNADNAQRLEDQLASQGFSVFNRERDNNLTSVLVGPYATSEDGETAMSLIKQRANVQGLLVRVSD